MSFMKRMILTFGFILLTGIGLGIYFSIKVLK